MVRSSSGVAAAAGKLNSGLLTILLAGWLCAHWASGELSIVQVILSSSYNDERTVSRVAVLGLDQSSANHLFRCSSSTIALSQLEWVKDGQPVKFRTVLLSSHLLMDMTDPKVQEEDQGDYTCRDSVTLEGLTISIRAASVALYPLRSAYVVREGANITLQVETVSFMPECSEVVQWSLGGFEVASGRDLVIESAQVEDGGVYHANFTQMTGDHYQTAVTSVSLTVQVLPRVVLSPVSMETSEHVRVVMMCEFTGSPRPTHIRWERRGMDLPILVRRDVTTSTFDPSGGQLFNLRSELAIPNTLVRDSGEYRCGAESSISDDVVYTLYARLQINHFLLLTAMLNSQSTSLEDESSRLLFVPMSSSVTIQCSGTGILNWTSSSGLAIPLITVGETPPIFQRTDLSISSQLLTITSVLPQYRGEFSCSTHLADGSDIHQAVFITSATPDVYIPVGVVYTSPGAIANITAIVRPSSPPRWLYGNTTITTATDHTLQNSSAPFYRQVFDGGRGIATLQVLNVAASILGMYRVQVTSGSTSREDQVQLLFPDTPSVTVEPAAVIVFEEVGVVLECLVTEGISEVVRWSGCGQMDLPQGVEIRGNSLVFSPALRSHSGCYNCTSLNSVSSASAQASVTVLYGPIAMVWYDGFLWTSTNQSETVTINLASGDSTHLLLCAGEGTPSPIATWYKVITSTSGESLVKVSWESNFSFRDTGRYVCMAETNSNSSRLDIHLIVNRVPIITTVFPVSQVTTSSPSSFFIPESYSGPAITCIGTGWPRPSLEWSHEGMEVVNSNSSSSPFSVSLSLPWEARPVAGGLVTCVAMGTINVSHTFRLDTLPDHVAPGELSEPQCDIENNVTFLQLRVLEITDKVCSENETSLSFKIQVHELLLSVVESLCKECGLVERDVIKIEQISCDKEGVVFSGHIAMATVALAQEAVCVLSKWWQTRPLVFLNDSFYELDPICSMLVPDSTEGIINERCASIRATGPPQVSPHHLIVVAIAVPAGVLLFILAVSVVLILVCATKNKNDGSVSSTHLHSNKKPSLQSQPSCSSEKSL